MKMPLEITIKGFAKNDEIDSLIRRKVKNLEKICDYMISCRVHVELCQKNQRSANRFIVQIDMRIPHNHEIVIKRKTDFKDTTEYLTKMIREAFDAAAVKLKNFVEKQNQHNRRYTIAPDVAFIERIFPQEGYGFLKTATDMREIYFHKNSIVHSSFDDLKIGTAVRFSESLGEKGPQASTVEVLSSHTLKKTLTNSQSV
ncbi:MAG: HPF/RaiA family ribosome-associated protein [Phycisphaerae bacterium]|nr:HPF/RaiA family ribosome-associated protein [Phycisphaerae bacterium]